MRTSLRALLSFLLCLLFTRPQAQCAGMTQAQVNWDNLDFFWVSTGAPYGDGTASYVTAAQAATQRFALGRTSVTFGIPANITIGGDTTIHNGEAGSTSTGADVLFTTTVTTNSSITLTFANDVTNLRFSIQDLDLNQWVNVTGANAGGTLQTVNFTRANASSTFTIGGTATNRQARGIATGIATTSNMGTVNVAIPTAVRTVTITFSNAVGDIYLSDLLGCIANTLNYTIGYHQDPDNQPFVGQPDYVLVTPQNNAVFMVNPVTGVAKRLFTDASRPLMNSLAYDSRHRILYYVAEAFSPSASNRSLKKYDFNTESSSTIITNINTTLNIPTFNSGIESGGAAFYDGSLYLGIEGGTLGNTSRESIIYRIDFAADGITPSSAAQVKAAPTYSSGTMIFDWADFIIRDGVLFDFNGAYSNTTPVTYENSTMIDYTLIDQTVVSSWMNPNMNTLWAGQAAMDWSGNLYSFWWDKNAPATGGIRRYNEDGTLGTSIMLTMPAGSTFNGTGDAAENFRPKADFGDAPTTYDPNSRSPALHEIDNNLRLGATVDGEWDKTASASANADGTDEDGLPYVAIMNLNGGNYQTELNVFNNTGADATVCAWVDFNNDGIFQSTEGILQTVPTSASMQTILLYWYGISAVLPDNSTTMLRVRVTSAANGMTVSNATGYYNNGEVEDYTVLVNQTVLAAHQVDFSALGMADHVQLKWQLYGDAAVAHYRVERSADGRKWQVIAQVADNGNRLYQAYDRSPLPGTAYYRLQTVYANRMPDYSAVQTVHYGTSFRVLMHGNPVRSEARLSVYAPAAGRAVVTIYTIEGQVAGRNEVVLLQGYNPVTLPLAQLPRGQYVLELQLGTLYDRKKILLTR